MVKKSRLGDLGCASITVALIMPLAVLTPIASAQTRLETASSIPTALSIVPLPPASFSSSALLSNEDNALPDAPELTAAARPKSDRGFSPGYRATRPFRSFALGLALGSGGIGVELATPLTSKLNLRGGASFFHYTTSFIVDTIPIDGTLHLTSAMVAVDWFPTGRSFHLSPGLTVYNDTTYNARIFIPGDQIVTLNGQDYTSDPLDPIHGVAFLKFGNRVAPRLTAGWGNVIRHRTGRFTFPIELGIEYFPPPAASFVLAGSSCQGPNDCGPIQNDPSTQQNILEQQQQIVDDLHPLRFFPILSVGISYKFGH